VTVPATDQIRAIRSEIDAAAEAILGSATEALQIVSALRGESALITRLQQTLRTVLEACAFHDLVCQRLDILDGAQQADDLLNGPAALGQGLDQAAADRLFEDLGGR